MPFGISWGQYLKMWAVSITGFVLGSHSVHTQYQPLANLDTMIEQEVERLREEHKLKKPTFDDKLKKILILDEEYIQKFKIDLKKDKV